MLRRSQKKESSIPIAIVVAIVLVASALLILRPSPERVVAVSSDGLLRLEGVARSSSSASIERLDGVVASIPGAFGPVYELTFQGSGTLQDAQLGFSFLEFDSGLAIQDVAVYRFNRETLAWEPLPTFFDLEIQTVTADIEFSGSLLVGLGEHVL